MDLMRMLGLCSLCSLMACGGSDGHGSDLACALLPGEQRLQGTVTEVLDGDTLTVGGAHRIRLSGIDAPELSQAFGPQSRSALKAMVQGQTVSVAYADTDRYGRLLGHVFASGCLDVNLRQVRTGSAWFYRAYQCDLSAAERTALALAEQLARASHEGLWAETSPVAPWLYRNGSEPEVPVCN